MNVLIVDESTIFRSRVRKALVGLDHEIVGTLSKGSLALQLVGQRDVDVLLIGLSTASIVGLDTVEKIKALQPKLRVIVFAEPGPEVEKASAKTRMLGFGRLHLKPVEDHIDNPEAVEQIRRVLVNSLEQTPSAAIAPMLQLVPNQEQNGAVVYKKVDLTFFNPMMCVIASSTGGPGALEVVVSKLQGPPRIPVLLAQHMPETFTRNLANRLSDISKVEVREAINGEPVKAGAILIAPGNFHMRVNRVGDNNYITLDQGPRVNSVRPAADLLFISAAQIYGPACAAFVLTGMGEDGCVGAKAIKQAGGGLMIQDKASCIVWGMPAAVERAGAYDAVGNLEQCAAQLALYCNAKEMR